MDSIVGQVIKGYKLRAQIGAGGFGAVYRAHQPLVGREVAIKVILPEYANTPEFIQRFELEAQLIAQLEHPYIVPLYDYWREPRGAFLVMRWLPSSLRHNLREGPWTLLEASHLIDQIATALTVAHRRGIIHRDVKPDNILLDDDNNAYLADFGMALIKLREGETSQALGTPAYLSPEQIRGESISQRSDIFSLAVVLFEMLTGSKPFDPFTNLKDLLSSILRKPFPSVTQINRAIPQKVDLVIQRASSKNPQDRYPDMVSFAQDLRKIALKYQSSVMTPSSRSAKFAVTTAEVPLPIIENPYKGLRAFLECDNYDFFGREKSIQRLVDRLSEDSLLARFLAVVGPSGSGKSSVIRAGLLPALRQNAIRDSQNWLIVEMVPGEHPIEELANALLRVAVNQLEDLKEQLWRNEHSLIDVSKLMLPADSELILFVDQFEEVFTLNENSSEGLHFLKLISAAIQSLDSCLRIVITLRADFYDRPLLHGDFSGLMRDRTEVVIPLTTSELEQAIVKPAQRAGLKVEDALVTAIIGEVRDQPGVLPLLQYALMELFETCKDQGVMTLQQYRNMGGTLGVLARRADECYNHLDEEQQNLAKQLFLRLVALGEGAEDIRRRVVQTDLLSLSEGMQKVINTFGNSRLLTFDRDPNTRSPTVEVAHEALLREWPRLRLWLDGSRSDIRLQRALSASALDWSGSGQDTSFLLHGSRLEQFEGWANETPLGLTKDERRFLQASIDERENQRAQERARQAQELALQRQVARQLRYLVIVLILFLVMAVGLTIIALSSRAQAVSEAENRATQQQIAVNNAVTATVAQGQALISLNRSESLRLAVVATNLLQNKNNAELAALLSIQSLKKLHTDEGDAALVKAEEFNFAEKVLTGHTDTVWAVAVSPDSHLIASGGLDGRVKLWRRETGQEVQEFVGHTDSVVGVAFSPDGKFLVSGSFDKSVRLWDVESGKEVREFVGTDRRVRSVAISPNGKYLAAGTGDWTVWLWDLQTGEKLRQMTGHKDLIYSVAFSPDSNTIITGSGDNTARLWDVQSGQELRQFTGHTDQVTNVAFSADGQSVLTGSWDKTARLWDIQTGKILQVFNGHTDHVNGVGFSPDGNTILTGSEDKTAILWDAKTGVEVERFANHTQGVVGVAFSPDGRFVVTGSSDRTLRIWLVNSQNRPPAFKGHSAAVISVAFSPDGKYILTGSEDKTTKLWDARTGRILHNWTAHVETSGQVTSVAFSPDGRYVLSGGDEQNGLAWLWDIQSGKPVWKFAGHTDWINQVAFVPNSRYILTASKDKTVRLWDIESGQMVRHFDHKGGVYALAVAPDGKTMVTGSDDSSVILWNIQTGTQIATWTGPTGIVFSAAFSPDGQTIITGSDDGIVRVWDAASGHIRYQITGHGSSPWVTVSPNGKYILTGNYGGGAALWDMQTGKEIRLLNGHTGVVRSVAFSPDGQYVLTGSNDTTARIWYTEYSDLIAQMCTVVQRDLSQDERSQFGIADNEPTCRPHQAPS